MASTYNDKNQTSGNMSTDLSKSVSKTVSGNNTASTASGATDTGAGAAASRDYGTQIGNYMNSAPQFQASDSLTAAQQYLSDITSNKPGSYVSKYTSQLDDLYGQLLNRGSFNYDMNGDALYKQYRQRYTEAGKKSSRDAMGQAAANTGGYASSYAQTAGADAYSQYMQQLQNAIPELQQQAQTRYNDQTTMLQNRYNLVQNADQNEYSRYRDNVSDWQNERSYAYNDAQQQYSNEYNQYANNMNNAMQQVSWEREDAANDKSAAMNQVNAWVSAGIKPSQQVVEAAGLDYDQFLQYWKKVK